MNMITFVKGGGRPHQYFNKERIALGRVLALSQDVIKFNILQGFPVSLCGMSL